jgi:hypothetical protein
MDLRIPRKIHVWGGLGSQLYGLNLYIRLNSMHSHFYRNILVLHSGGVTERRSELDPLIVSGDCVHFISDFNDKPSNATSELSKPYLRNFAKIVLKTIGVLNSCDNEFELSKIRPWCFEIRGHYGHLEVRNETIKEMIRRASINQKSVPLVDESRKSYCIHMRNGDLTRVKPSSYIGPNEIINLINAMGQSSRDSFLISSDSIGFAITHFKNLSLEIEFLDADSWSTICALVNSNTFIGTNSKISQWVCIFRNFIHDTGRNVIPVGFKTGLMANRPKIFADYY